MATKSSAMTFLIEGVKFSLEVMKDISNDLPPPTSSIVNLVIRVIAAIEARFVFLPSYSPP